MKAQTIQPRIERGTTKLIVPYENREITFAHLPFSGTSLNIREKILENNLQIPTAEQTVALLHAAYCSDVRYNREFHDIREIMLIGGLFVFNRNLLTDKGIYVIQDTEAEGLSEDIEVYELEEMLKYSDEINGVRFSEDRKVRFAPKDTYKLRYKSSIELSQNGFVVASYGVEGAKQLTEISRDERFLSGFSYVHGLNILEGNTSKLGSSALRVFKVFEIPLGAFSFLYDSNFSNAFGLLK